MTKEIVFEPINFEDVSQKSKTQFTTKVFVMENGKKTYADEETKFMCHEYSGFASAKYNPPEKRDWMKIPIDPEQQSCLDIEKQVNMYDDALAASRDIVFGKYSKLYTHAYSIKNPKEEDELEAESADPDKIKKPKFKSLKLKLDIIWTYYLDGERLDAKNSGIVRKTISEAFAKNKDKTIIDTLSFPLTFTDENGKSIKRIIKMSELEQRKDINTKVFYRKPESIPADAKKISECDEDELVKYYGESQLQDVRTPDDLDKYYRHGSHIRFIYTPQKIWAAKAKDDNGKRKFSYQWVCKQLDIIHVYTQNNSQSIVRNQYTKYAFGKKNINQMLIKNNDDYSNLKSSSNTKSNSKQIEKEVKDEQEEEVEVEDEVEEEEVEEEEVEDEVEEVIQINSKHKSKSKVTPVIESKSKTKSDSVRKGK